MGGVLASAGRDHTTQPILPVLEPPDMVNDGSYACSCEPVLFSLSCDESEIIDYTDRSRRRQGRPALPTVVWDRVGFRRSQQSDVKIKL